MFPENGVVLEILFAKFKDSWRSLLASRGAPSALMISLVITVVILRVDLERAVGWMA
jgi:hypothetical protein